MELNICPLCKVRPLANTHIDGLWDPVCADCKQLSMLVESKQSKTSRSVINSTASAAPSGSQGAANTFSPLVHQPRARELFEPDHRISEKGLTRE